MSVVTGVAIETYGCAMNRSDSDIIRYRLIEAGFNLTSTEKADVVVINSCGVIAYTERKILKRVEKLKSEGKKVVIAGCLPRISSRKVREIADAAVGTDSLLKIDVAVKSAIAGLKFFDIKKSNIDKASLEKFRLDKDELGMRIGFAVVPIAEGCTGRCTFCATRFARGKLKSFSMESIVKDVKRAVNCGFVEIQLTSQDTGAYGIDRYGYHALPELLERIARIPGNFKVRVGMMNPRHAYEMLDSLICAFSNDKIYKFIHVPVQSGDENVLKSMGRDHGVEEYLEVVSSFRKEFDHEDTIISTDIITGFPEESEEAFHRSLELIRESKPDLVNVTRYSPRKGTPAYRLGDMPDWIKKERSRAITRLADRIKEKRNARLVGKSFTALITKFSESKVLARLNSYRPVIIENSENFKPKSFGLIGVRITSSTSTHLIGLEVPYFGCKGSVPWYGYCR
ncbi:MAG: threonylcarbamoyladenosine tRNA methylthiotransferase [Archaeoglobus sp.]|nr:MAG: threonylcarbamoyladenosine tRNA methylthiotransferase [Archaeoglobus sp.]